MRHIKSILLKNLEDLDKGNRLDGDTICKQAEEIIKKSAPDTRVLFYKNKTIYIKSPSAIIANELFLKQEKIKEKLNKLFKKQIIKKIIIKS